MFLFLRLILAHFIGDFVLQSDEVYEVKKEGLRGVCAHSAIVFLSFVVFSLPYLQYPATWLIIALAGITHIIQDEVKLRYVTIKKLSFPAFVLDQILHVGMLSPILLCGFAYGEPQGTSRLIEVYRNTSLIIFITGYIASMFMGAYLWESFKVSYFRSPEPLKSFGIKHGMFERLIITTSFLKFPYLVFLLVPVLFRLLAKKVSFSWGFLFNLIYAGAIGILLKQFLPVF